MNDSTRDRLKEKVAAISFDPQICASYKHDLGEIPDLLMAQIDSRPQAVAIPRSLEEIVEILSVALETRTPVTPRGQASSGFGGAIPTKGGILLDFSGMNTIMSVDTKNMTVDVEPGVIWESLSHELQKQGLDNRICPTSAPSATIAGWFCMGGVGIGSLRYGSIADVVEEIEVVGLDGQVRIFTGKAMQPYYQTCGTLGVISRLRLKCRPAEEILPFAVQLPDAEAVQTFLERMCQSFKADNIMVQSDGYVQMRKAAGGHHFIPKGHFLAVVAIPEADVDAKLLSTVIQDARGELLSEELAQEEWADRFYPMRIKKIGPTVLVSEFYLPQEHFADAWQEIANDLRRDMVGMEALAVSGNKMAILVYIPDCSKDLLYPLRMAKAVRPLNIARRYQGYAYTSGLWFAAESKEVLGGAKLTAYLQEKKKLDPNGLLNPGKIIAPRMRWLPMFNLGTLVQLGSALTSPLARFITYRQGNLAARGNGDTNEH